MKIAPSFDVYFPESKKAYVELKSQVDKSKNLSNWESLTTEALIAIYGTNIYRFSAKGTRSDSRPAIPKHIYDAIYGKNIIYSILRIYVTE